MRGDISRGAGERWSVDTNTKLGLVTFSTSKFGLYFSGETRIVSRSLRASKKPKDDLRFQMH